MVSVITKRQKMPPTMIIPRGTFPHLDFNIYVGISKNERWWYSSGMRWPGDLKVHACHIDQDYDDAWEYVRQYLTSHLLPELKNRHKRFCNLEL